MSGFLTAQIFDQNGFSYQEISRITGHSVSNVGYLIHVGMKSIRSRMTEAPTARA